MVPKRHFDHGKGDDGFEILPSQEPKRRYTFKNVVRDVMREHVMTEFLSIVEPLFRSVIREEVEHSITTFFKSSQRPQLNEAAGTSGGQDLQLHFENNLPSTIFTGTKIQADDNNPLKIVLRDASSQKIIQSGPLSSAKLEILVLNGEFGSDDQEDWTEREFNANVLREREGRRPLITGDLTVYLKYGVGYVNDISFTDNSSWIRSRKFMLGARIKQKFSSHVRVKEARSLAFKVKDQRGEGCKKHHPPRLHDEVWRLEKIAKDGKFHSRLAACGVNSVKDFLRLYETNPASLREVFGKIPEKTWKKVVEHATTCFIDGEEFYTYYNRDHGVCLVLNSVYKAVGAAFHGTHFRIDELNFLQKRAVEDLKLQAYMNLKDLIPLDLFNSNPGPPII